MKLQSALVAVQNDKSAVRYFECGGFDSGNAHDPARFVAGQEIK